MNRNLKFAIAGSALGLGLFLLGWRVRPAEYLLRHDRPIAQTLDLLWKAESSKGTDPNMNHGDSGRARGHFQHWQVAWDYGCGQLGVDWPYSDADNLARAAAVTAACWSGQARGDLLAGDIEMLIRRHRLPNAPHRSSNDNYLEYVLQKGD